MSAPFHTDIASKLGSGVSFSARLEHHPEDIPGVYRTTFYVTTPHVTLEVRLAKEENRFDLAGALDDVVQFLRRDLPAKPA